ncbi:MAG: hypothetical protein RR531_11625 [Longicatena sp.]
MNELQRMNQKIKVLTFILMGVAMIVGAIIALMWNHNIYKVVGGVAIGALVGLIGFQMISRMTKSIEYAGNAQASGYFGYMMRYLMYGLVFAASIFCGINAFALLAGFTCHKIAIIFYSLKTREEDD